MLPVAPALLLLAASTAAAGPTGMLKTEDDDAMRRHLEESMPPVPSPRIKKVHIVSLTHLDVGGYGPPTPRDPGVCEDDCKWAADVCNTYFDVYLPAAVATAEELRKAAKTPATQPPHHQAKCPPGRGEAHEPDGWYRCPGYHKGFSPSDCKAVGCCVNEARFANVSRYPKDPKAWAGWCFPDHGSNSSNKPNHTQPLLQKDCQLNGEFRDGVCICDSGWIGQACGILDLLPVSAEQQGNGSTKGLVYPPPAARTSSWGGGILSHGGLFHLVRVVSRVFVSRLRLSHDGGKSFV